MKHILPTDVCAVIYLPFNRIIKCTEDLQNNCLELFCKQHRENIANNLQSLNLAINHRICSIILFLIHIFYLESNELEKFYVLKYNPSKESKFECDRVSYSTFFTILKDQL